MIFLSAVASITYGQLLSLFKSVIIVSRLCKIYVFTWESDEKLKKNTYRSEIWKLAESENF